MKQTLASVVVLAAMLVARGETNQVSELARRTHLGASADIETSYRARGAIGAGVKLQWDLAALGKAPQVYASGYPAANGAEATAKLPKDAVAWYVNFFTADGKCVSGEFFRESDDTAAIQSRIDAAWKLGGGEVIVEPGEHRVRPDISYDDIPEFPSWRIESDAQRAKWGLPPLKVYSAAGLWMFEMRMKNYDTSVCGSGGDAVRRV